MLRTMQPTRRWNPAKERVSMRSSASQLADVRPLLERIVSALGSNAVARLLGISPTVVARVKRGGEISAETTRRIAALHSVLTRAATVFEPRVAVEWLTTGREPLLADARPLDVLALRGPGAVLDALDGIEAGVMR
jgi:uncharacterized protein (DUF2384 family)